MSTLIIRKRSLKTWVHTDSILGDFIISKFYFNADNVSFQIVEQGQSRRVIYNINDITLYNTIDGGGAETFTTITQLSLRLEQLNYPAFQLDGQITSIANLLEGGDGVEITGDGTEASPYIINLTSGDALFLGSYNTLVALQTAHPTALNGSYAFVNQNEDDIVYFFSEDVNNWWTISGGVTSVNTKTGAVVLNQDEILDGTTYKQYSLTEKNKLAGIEDGAQVNVNADWNATSGDAFIENKPSITTPTLQEVLLEGDRPVKNIKLDYTFEDADRGKYLLITDAAELTLNPNTLAANSELLIKKSGEGTFVVKLIAGTGVVIYFNDTEITNGDFLTIEQDDLFILKQDGNTDKWYLSIISSSQTSATPRLSEVLTESNETDGNDIAISDGDKIVLDNGANLKKGTTDAGLGGSKGIALRCAVDYELKWEAGRLYVMEGDGFTIREVSHNFTTIPTENDDDSKGFVVGSRWILDDGEVYLCGDATTGFAVWEIVNTGTTPTLQEVTSAGNETTNSIIINDNSIVINNNENLTSFEINGYELIGTDVGSNTPAFQLGFDGLMYAYDPNRVQYIQSLRFDTEGDIIQQYEFPSKPTGEYTIATTSDIPTLVAGTNITIDDADPLNPIISATGGGGGGVPYTGATQDLDLGTHSLLAKNLVVNHPSGSGDAATITKGGSGEALKVIKTSGSGNAASITGGFTLLDELHLTTDLADAYIASASTWNAKQNALSYTPYKNVQTSQTVHTGTTLETNIFTATIPANSFNSQDVIKVLFGINKTTSLAAYTLRLRLSTTNNPTGGTLIALYTGGIGLQSVIITRNYNLNGGNLYGVSFPTTILTDQVATNVLSSTALNPANQFFIHANISLANAGDSINISMLSIHN